MFLWLPEITEPWMLKLWLITIYYDLLLFIKIYHYLLRLITIYYDLSHCSCLNTQIHLTSQINSMLNVRNFAWGATNTVLSVPRRVFMHNFNPSPNSSMDMGAPRHLQLNAKDKQHFKLFNFFCCLYWRRELWLGEGITSKAFLKSNSPDKNCSAAARKTPLGDSCSITNPCQNQPGDWKFWKDTAGKVNPSRFEISAPPSRGRGENQRLRDVNAKQSF